MQEAAVPAEVTLSQYGGVWQQRELQGSPAIVTPVANHA